MQMTRFYLQALTIIIATAAMPAYAQDKQPPAAKWTATELNTGYVVFEHNPMVKLAATHVPDRDAVVKEISFSLAGGEYESIQIAVHALANDIKTIRIEVESDLEVSIYHRINPDVKRELDKVEMTWIDWMDSAVYLQRGDLVEKLDKGQSVNFWLTFRADSKTSAGLHTGEIRITPALKQATRIQLKAQVRPFQLQTPRVPFGMYHREDMLPTRFGSWSIAAKTAQAFYRDMAAHGQNSVSISNAGNFNQLPPHNTRLVERVGLAKEVGLISPDVPSLLIQATIAEIEQGPRQAAAAYFEAQHLKQGWPELIPYGWDEPPFPAPGLRETYLPMRDVSIRLCTALDSTGAYAHGDVHDVWIVIGGEITPQMITEAKRRGAQVWSYSYRIWREGFEPLRQRYYAGLYTWANKLGGNFVWAYSHGHHGHVWWLPGSDEPMPTTAWEARREGVDDYRYLQMLEDQVSIKTSDPLVIEARTWLHTLRARLLAVDPHLIEVGKPLTLEEYDEIPAKASAYIEALGAQTSIVKSWPVTHLKDEAAAFRGKTVDQCITALGADDPSIRRAAAWALFELGPDGAAAVDALADALDDPQVRIPALRALEMIGPDAYTAVPQVTTLLAHPDAFIRLGATFTLVGIARQPSWNDVVGGYLESDTAVHGRILVAPLRQALRSADHQAVKLAALGLFRCGPAAAPALPEAMELMGLTDDGRPRDDGSLKEFGLKVLSGMGPDAAFTVTGLTKLYEQSKGQDALIARTLAAIGPAALEAVPILQKYRTMDNPFLVDTCYALFCIRGGEAELLTMARIIGDKDVPRGHASGQWPDAVRFLIALGTKAAPAVPIVRERRELPAVKEREPTLYRRMELILTGVEQGREPLRLMPR